MQKRGYICTSDSPDNNMQYVLYLLCCHHAGSLIIYTEAQLIEFDKSILKIEGEEFQIMKSFNIKDIKLLLQDYGGTRLVQW